MFTLEALQARHGDCLLLRWGDPGSPQLAVIDGGPSGVYRSSLKPRLEALGAEPGAASPLPVRLLMVSHIDDDHIHGVLDLTRELIDLRRERRAEPWKVVALWHNSFDDVVGSATPLTASLASAVQAVAMGGAVPAGLPIERDSALVLASVPQGRQLRDDARALNIAVNAPLGSLVWAPASGQRAVPLEGGLTLTVVGPLEAQVRKLQADWDAKLREMQGRSAAEAQAIAAEFVDKSVYNLSSIVALAERGGRRMLLTGDARGDFVLEGLEAAGLLEGGAIHVDVLKVPHHGSQHNVAAEFFRRVTADRYVISANGRDGNPDPPMLAMLTDARGADEYAICLTNQPPHVAEFFAADRPRGRRYEVLVRDDPALSLAVAVQA